jgi:hypothetical protein
MAKFTSKSTGDQLSASEYNNVQLPREDILTTSGITGVNGDNTQLAKAVANYAAVSTYYTDSGAADAYVLNAVNSFRSPTAYVDGLEVRFRAGNANTGAATVNVAGLGVKNIKKQDGTTDLSATDITIGQDTYLRYDLANDAMIIVESLIGNTLESVQIFTSSGTWNKPAGINSVLVQLVGAGGSGASTTIINSAGGAGAGGYAQSFITSGLGSSEIVTVGVGGVGVVSGNPGNNGGTTSFGAHLSATGGSGGTFGSGFGGTGGSGIVNTGVGFGTIGQSGGTGQVGSGAGGNGDAAGCGGSSFFGGGGAGGSGSTVGSAPGIGGGAPSTLNGGTSVAGGDGLVIIYEYS